jgi:protein-L-isoaspartate(D-aspartate) O-methyltransferase
LTGDREEEKPLNHLISSLKKEGILKSSEVEAAIRSIKREDFLWPGEPKFSAYIDEPSALGSTGQTISAPHMITIMLEEAKLQRGQRVLEIGAGSGYNAALIGFIVSGGGNTATEQPLVTTVERDHVLAEFARANLKRAGLERIIEIVEGDGSLGYPQGANKMIYDRIIVTAGAPYVPPYLEKQLNISGILLIPVGTAPFQTLMKITKSIARDGEPELFRENMMAVMFVPLIGESAYNDKQGTESSAPPKCERNEDAGNALRERNPKNLGS